MPLLGSSTLLLTHSLALLLTSFILLSQPALLTSSAPVWLLGEAMHIRDTPSFSSPSEPLAGLALLAAVLALIEGVFAAGLGAVPTSLRPAAGSRREIGAADGGVSEGRVASSSDIRSFAEKVAVLHAMQGRWMAISMIQCLGFGLLVMVSYLTSPREQVMGYVVPVERGQGWLGLGMLNNRVVFVGALVEMLFWGYLWTVLKEEAGDLARMIKLKRGEGREKGNDDWGQ